MSPAGGEPERNLLQRFFHLGITHRVASFLFLLVASLLAAGGLPLGVFTDTRYETGEVTLAPGDVQTIDFRLELPELYPAHFSFTPGISNGTLESYEVCDFIDNALALPAEKGRAVYGYMHLPFQIDAHDVRRGAQPAGLPAQEGVSAPR